MKETTLITGNTFAVKDGLKALGGKWDADAKGWRVPEDKVEEAQALVASAPAEDKSTKKPFQRKKYYSCQQCGSRQNRGYKLCWDCKSEYDNGEY